MNGRPLYKPRASGNAPRHFKHIGRITDSRPVQFWNKCVINWSAAGGMAHKIRDIGEATETPGARLLYPVKVSGYGTKLPCGGGGDPGQSLLIGGPQSPKLPQYRSRVPGGRASSPALKMKTCSNPVNRVAARRSDVLSPFPGHFRQTSDSKVPAGKDCGRRADRRKQIVTAKFDSLTSGELSDE